MKITAFLCVLTLVIEVLAVYRMKQGTYLGILLLLIMSGVIIVSCIIEGRMYQRANNTRLG